MSVGFVVGVLSGFCYFGVDLGVTLFCVLNWNDSVVVMVVGVCNDLCCNSLRQFKNDFSL